MNNPTSTLYNLALVVNIRSGERGLITYTQQQASATDQAILENYVKANPKALLGKAIKKEGSSAFRLLRLEEPWRPYDEALQRKGSLIADLGLIAEYETFTNSLVPHPLEDQLIADEVRNKGKSHEALVRIANKHQVSILEVERVAAQVEMKEPSGWAGYDIDGSLVCWSRTPAQLAQLTHEEPLTEGPDEHGIRWRWTPLSILNNLPPKSTIAPVLMARKHTPEGWVTLTAEEPTLTNLLHLASILVPDEAPSSLLSWVRYGNTPNPFINYTNPVLHLYPMEWRAPNPNLIKEELPC